MRVLIADDERLARDRMARLARAIPEVEVIAVCDSGEAVLRALETHRVDLALLDIHMPDLSGLELAGLLGQRGPAIIFVTAHPEHALEAFGVGATHYLLKPVDAASLAQAIDRVRPRSSPGLGPIAIPGARGLQLLHPQELRYATVDGASLALHLDGQVRYTSMSLSELERQLPAERFVRVHRRTVIALSALAEIRGSGAEAIAILRSGESIELSRRGARALRQRLKD
ncbi:MAG: DNA-binding response regulator [Deltaproteobacteria bacterium]|nr:MAG: DNA-binding response regulator [Deltaproteobacteria bacterium]